MERVIKRMAVINLYNPCFSSLITAADSSLRSEWQLTVFLITGIDPSICFGWRLTMDTTLSAGPGAVKIPAVPVCLTSFRTVVRMPYWKDRKQDGDTEWRIYYSHDALPLFPITVIDPSRSFRMTPDHPLITAADPSHSLQMAFFRSLSIRHYTGYVIIDIYKYMNKLQFWKKVFLCGRKQYLPRHCLQVA